MSDLPASPLPASPPPAPSPAAPKRHRVGVIGAGRVGAVLAVALQAAGHQVVAVSGSSAASLLRIQTLLPHLSPQSPQRVARTADLLLLAVPDDRLEGVASGLAESGALRAGQVVVHTSGRHGTAVLAAAARCGAVPVALHPAMTFTGTDVDLGRLAGCVFGLTAEGPGRLIGEQLARDLHARTAVVPEEQRTLYHAALAHGANHLVTLVGQAMDLLRAAGSTDPAATLAPLLRAAMDNTLAYGDAALTGPVVRGDSRTVASHLAALDRLPVDRPQGASGGDDDIRSAYTTMARLTAARAARSGRLSRAAAAEIHDLTDWASTTR